jgi:deazaflavin-dependent oxidoreductase (nitroreductase family)
MTDAADWNAFNRDVINDFRANAGKVSGGFAGAPMILITYTGAKSGKEYTIPLVYSMDGDRPVIIASKGGAPEDPQWFRSLVANPEITVEIGTDKFRGRARVAEGAERDRLFRAQADLMPNFDEYATKTTRVIPVVVIERT